MKNILIFMIIVVIYSCNNNTPASINDNNNNTNNKILTITPNLIINVEVYGYDSTINNWIKTEDQIQKYNTTVLHNESFYYRYYGKNWNTENYDKNMGTKIQTEWFYNGILNYRETNIFDQGKYFIYTKKDGFDKNGNFLGIVYSTKYDNDNGKLIRYN